MQQMLAATDDAGFHAGEAEETFVLPASVEQNRYWTLAQLDPASTASNMAISFEIQGRLDRELVEKTVAALTLRHEALRTIFRIVDGELSQVILARALYGFSTADLSDLPAEHRESALDMELRRHSHLLVDLHYGPVLHARLIRIAPERHVLALTMNHIVCDGWSNGILVRDFLKLYDAHLSGLEPDLPALPFQYADFSAWQAEYLQSERPAAGLTYWREHITRNLPALDMPADFPRTAGRSFPGDIESALLPAALNDLLMQYCRTTGSTKHIVLLAAFQALCTRHTGQLSFLLGSTIANRTQPGMENIVGRFANPQIVVADVENDPTFHQLEARVRDWETTAYTHQDLPFSRIIEAFQMDGASATSNFLQVWFVYQKAFMQPQSGAGLQIKPRRSVSGGVDFDMLVSVVERTEGPRLQIEYNTTLFSAQTVRDLVGAFQALLQHALEAPGTRVSALDLGGSAQLPALARPTSQTEPAQKNPVPALLSGIEKSARESPDATAVAMSGGATRLTWRGLAQQSDALVCTLVNMGLTAGSSVVLQMMPHIEVAVAAVAALKIGARVLPLPSTTDAGQLHSACDVVRAQAVLGMHSLVGGLAGALPFESIATLPVSPEQTSATADASHWLFVADAGNPVPAISEASLPGTLHALERLASRLSFSANDAILSLHPGAGDVAWLDLLLALQLGASLVLHDPGTGSSFQAVADAEQITAVLATESDWRRLQLSGWRGDRRIAAVVRDRRSSAWDAAFLGQTSRAAWRVLLHPGAAGPIAVARITPHGEDRLALLDPAHVAVTDAAGHAVAAGGFGELSTSEGFRTGLLAVPYRDSSFKLLESTDRMVQLSGHRLRMCEIEGALLKQSDILDAQVTVLRSALREPLLAAFVVPGSPGVMTTQSIRKDLLESLPKQLVPQEIFLVAQFPRTLDGSVDFARLPQHPPVVLMEPSQSSAPAAAMDDVEARLTRIWRDVLGTDHIDGDSSFFNLGGNSLLLVRLFTQINRAFGTSLPITSIFDAGTIGKLAQQLRKQTEVRPIVHVQTRGERPPLFMIHSYLLYQGLSGCLGNDQPFYGLRELEDDGELSVEDRVAKYVREIRRVQPRGPYAIAGWCAAGPLTVEVARQLLDRGEQVASVILFDSWLPGYQAEVEKKRRHGWLPNLDTFRSKLSYNLEKMRGLPAGERLAHARMSVRRIALEGRNRLFLRHWSTLNRISQRFHVPLPQFMYNTSLQTFAALRAYREQSLPIQLTLIRASDAREVRGASVSCGWERVAEHGVQVLWAPGNHETMFIGSNLRATADLVRGSLAPEPEVWTSPLPQRPLVLQTEGMAGAGSA